MTTKELHTAWIRAGANFTTAHQQLEEELQRMKDKKLAQEFIDRKDQQIEMLVNFFNQTEELLNYYKLAMINARMENHFLTEMLLKNCTLQDVLDYKPSKKIQIINTETGDAHTLSELNG